MEVAVLKYLALLFVAEGSDFTLPAAARELASMAPPCPDRIDQAVSGEVRAYFGGWCLKVFWWEDAESRDEAEKLASKVPSVYAADIVWGPHRLARVWSEDSGPDDQHLEDYVRIVNLLVERFSGVVAADPEAPEDWGWKRPEEDVNSLVWYAHRHPPRCISDLCPVPLRQAPRGLRIPPYAAYFAVGCPCGKREVYAVGYHTKTMYGQAIFVSPLSLECLACGRLSELIDTRKHGYNGEQGGDCNIAGEGCRGRFPCPRCGEVPMVLMPGFSFQGDYFEPNNRGPKDFFGRRPQDFFGVFWLYGQCCRCGSVLLLVDGFECA
jgi:hypothetical protein